MFSETGTRFFIHQQTATVISKLRIFVIFFFVENQDINRQDIQTGDDIKPVITNPVQPAQPTNTNWHSLRKLIQVPKSAQKGYSVGHWPIPEAFWPDVSNSTLVSGSFMTVYLLISQTHYRCIHIHDSGTVKYVLEVFFF